MTFAPESPRPVLAAEVNEGLCEECGEEMDSEWDYCPFCGDFLATQARRGSEFACSCSDKRMAYSEPGKTSERGRHSCEECGAIWFGLERWPFDIDRDPDEWDLAKAEAQFATYLAETFGFELPRKAVPA